MSRKNNNAKRMPGGVIVFPPFPPGGGPGPVIPPWIIPKPPGPGPNPGPFPPVPPLPPQEDEKLTVKIKSVFENKFVVVGQNGYLYAGEDKYNQQAGLFKFIMDKNNVIIREKGGNFVRLDNKNFLIADTNKKGATVFKVYKVDKEQYVLQAPNGYFVKVRDKDNLLVAKAEEAGPRTVFKFKIIE